MFEILEPQLPKNRERFKRLKRRQLHILFTAPVLGMIYLVTMAILSAPAWTDRFIFVIVGAAGGAIIYLELLKIKVFQNDLRESRGMEAE